MAHVYQSRWGYHPCDYETFRVLKKLNAYFEQARRRYAQWKRWNRKQPHNRVLRKKIIEQGLKIGSQVIGPKPEPVLCYIFCTRQPILRYWDVIGKLVRKEGELVSLDHGEIPAAYRAARMPVPSPDLVLPLVYSPEELRSLLAQAETA